MYARIKTILFLLLMAGLAPVMAEPAFPDPHNVLIADFETQGAWQIHFRTLSEASGYVRIEDLDPGPIVEAPAYLHIRFRGPEPTGFRIQPKQPFALEGYIESLDFWAYGTGRPDQVDLEVLDQNDRLHRIRGTSLEFTGWRHFQVRIPPAVQQRAVHILGRNGLQFRGFFVQPAAGQTPADCRFHLDQIGARVWDYYQAPAMTDML
ncbi:MAG: hypothetical protein KDK34_04150 [Leptospiraceae bacterium]|nr:hypothetical protein [Leptospiraceae bacterium]